MRQAKFLHQFSKVASSPMINPYLEQAMFTFPYHKDYVIGCKLRLYFSWMKQCICAKRFIIKLVQFSFCFIDDYGVVRRIRYLCHVTEVFSNIFLHMGEMLLGGSRRHALVVTLSKRCEITEKASFTWPDGSSVRFLFFERDVIGATLQNCSLV